jgi:GntR family transcriptional repressor for pyruvate dehydrogenase complex
VRTHELVLGWVEAELAAHRLVLGDRLPPERALAADLAVSRTAVREALKVLEAMGVVRSGVGSGPAAGTVVIAEPGAALGAALRLHVATDHITASDVVETRVLLETWAAGHAMPDSPELDQAEGLIERMEASGEAVDHFLVLDAAFHVALTRAAGNPLINAMMAALRESIEGYTLSLTAKLPDWTATSTRLRREHRAILAAIRTGDATGAAALLRRHIEGYTRSLTAKLPDWAATSARLRREHRAILAAIRTGDGAGAAALLRRHIEGYFHEAETGIPPRPDPPSS